MRHNQEPRQRQVQRTQPRLIQANWILQASHDELERAIDAEVMDNPALEVRDAGRCRGDCPDPLACPDCSTAQRRPPPQGSQGVTQSASIPYAAGISDPFDRLANIAASPSLHDHLIAQLHAAAPEELHAAGDLIIHNLDHRGWFTGDLASVAADARVSERIAARALEAVQDLEPAGVGARDVRESLLIQLADLESRGLNAQNRRTNRLAVQLLDGHFDHVVARRHADAAAAVGASPDEVREALEYIRARLSPYPASGYRAAHTAAPDNADAIQRPDVIVRRSPLGFEVHVPDAFQARLAVAEAYRSFAAPPRLRVGGAADAVAATYAARANSWVAGVRDRTLTLRRIAEALVESQSGFFETGSRRFLRPLTRASLAKRLALHESIVSRATQGKVVQLPNDDIVPFSVFFTRSVSAREAIVDLIAGEDPRRPFSDAQLAEMLKAQGIDIARRTVLKYREAERILSSTARRQR